MPPFEPARPWPRVVLDTNVVLGWLLFGDRACLAIGRVIAEGKAVWLVDATLRDELAHVLTRGIRGWPTAAAPILKSFDANAKWVDTPTTPLAPGDLRCTDPDDQKFIDLALRRGADLLLSRDRAVLKLAKRASARGLTIATPEEWFAALQR